MTFATATGTNFLGVSEYGESPNIIHMMYFFKFSCYSSRLSFVTELLPYILGTKTKFEPRRAEFQIYEFVLDYFQC
jgi:hypothetical protein